MRNLCKGIVALVWLLAPALASAEAARTFYGSNAGQPTFERPGFDEPPPFDFTVRYSVQPFRIDADGLCSIRSVQEGNFDGVIFLYHSAFDPDQPDTNLIEGSDDGPDPYNVGLSQILDRQLDSDTDYFLVTTGFELADVGEYSNQIYCASPVTNIVPADGNLPTFDGRFVELLNGRFRVSITWEDFSGGSGQARSVPLGSTDSALFWFFEPANFEALIKIVDGCSFNGHYWVYLAATTNVGFTLRIRDQQTEEMYVRTNPLGTKTITDLADIDAFANCP